MNLLRIVLLILIVLLTLLHAQTASGGTGRSDGSVPQEKLASPDAAERARAACELGEAGPPGGGAIASLVKLLEDDTPVAPGGGCGHFNFRSDAEGIEGTSPGREAGYALAEMGESSVSLLINALSSPKPSARRNSAIGLG